MARTNTDLPEGEGHLGERRFAERLVELLSPEADVWFGPVLTGVFDIDALFHDPEIGFFVVEVKAVDLSGITEYSPSTCRIRGRGGSASPVKQAKQARDSLVAYIRDITNVTYGPYVHVTGAFPKINRADFLEQWGSGPVAAQAESMLFADDLTDSATLFARLRQATLRPPIGGAPKRKPDVPYPEIEQLRIDLNQRPVRPSPADIKKMHAIGRAAGNPRPKSRLATYTKSEPGRKVRLSGPPGTGKTDMLLKIALSRAHVGQRVLFTCYNKVLRSEISRLLAASNADAAAIASIDVIHISSLEIECNEGRWDTEHYDTLLVDEAQDFPDSGEDLLSTLSDESTEWFAADGQGQELYRHPCTWVEAFRRDAEEWRQEFRYRSSGPLALLAAATRTHAPDVEKGVALIERRGRTVSTSAPQDDLYGSGDLDEPSVPTLIRLPLEQNTSQRARIDFIKGLIEDEQQRLDLTRGGGNLAILVARNAKSGYETEWAKCALDELNISYKDQTSQGDHRLEVVPPGIVRLVTMHSARGLEASRVLVLGLGWLGGITFGGDAQQQQALAYVALSRASLSLTIAAIPTPDHSEKYIDFSEKIIEALSIAG